MQPVFARFASIRNRTFGIGLLVLALTLGACKPEPEIPSYWQSPVFTLTSDRGQSFPSSELSGRVVLADFIYTSCADTCPALTASFLAIQHRLKADGLFPSKVALVSFTVDPERDSPAVLQEYGARVGADPAGWHFLTGERAALEETLLQGFKLPFRGPTPAGPLRPGYEISHTNRVVLIDRSGTIRGLLQGQELDVEQTVRTIKRLAS